ncbi:MAG TPA: sigma-70 family RNA polymerase sigma factor [Gaiellaceae bacterium]|nr:sigma-70 family RNA polymerase sigma factor [Gaiellaceae bacterium]
MPPRQEVESSLVERARAGDRDAYTALIRRYDRGLRALAFRLLGDRDRMDDALQEAYVRAFRSLPRFRGAAGIGTWLYRIAYNACLDELERGRRSAALELALDGRGDGRGDPAETAVRPGDLEAALAALAPGERAAVLLVDAHGFHYASAAEVLGVPAGTVASRLNRARTALRRALEHPREGAPER